MGLNFAFEEEAETFLHCAKTTVANRNRRREGKKNKLISFITASPCLADSGINSVWSCGYGSVESLENQLFSCPRLFGSSMSVADE